MGFLSVDSKIARFASDGKISNLEMGKRIKFDNGVRDGGTEEGGERRRRMGRVENKKEDMEKINMKKRRVESDVRRKRKMKSRE